MSHLQKSQTLRSKTEDNQLTIKCSISSVCKYWCCTTAYPLYFQQTPCKICKNQTKQLSKVSETRVSALTGKHHAWSWQILFEGKCWGKHQNGNSSWLAFDAASDCEDIFVQSLRQLLPGLAAGGVSVLRNIKLFPVGVRRRKRSQNGVKHHVFDRKSVALGAWEYSQCPSNIVHVAHGCKRDASSYDCWKDPQEWNLPWPMLVVRSCNAFSKRAKKCQMNQMNRMTSCDHTRPLSHT